MFVDMTTPLGAIGLDDVQALPDGTRAEFERTASIDGCRGPHLAVSGGDVDAVTAAFRRSPYLRDVTLIAEDEGRSVYQLSWNGGRPELLRSISESGGTVLSAVAAGDRVAFELRFPDQASASRFYAVHDGRENPISIRRSSHTPNVRRSSIELTAKQREALTRALETGYFEIPRKVGLVELAGEFGITDNAMSERIRRGTATLVRNADRDS